LPGCATPRLMLPFDSKLLLLPLATWLTSKHLLGIRSTPRSDISSERAFLSPILGARMSSIRLFVNGRAFAVDADPQTSLLSLLREHLDFTGTKYGCGEGQCGACTVLIDGKALRSCITKAVAVAQKQITTIEGLAKGDQLHPVQQAFLDED